MYTRVSTVLQLVLDVRSTEESLQCLRTLLMTLSEQQLHDRLHIVCVAAFRSIDLSDHHERLWSALQEEARRFGITDSNALVWLPVLFSEADGSNPSPLSSSSSGEDAASSFAGPMSVVAPGRSGGRFWTNWSLRYSGSKPAVSTAPAGLVLLRDLRARLEHLLREHLHEAEPVPDLYHRFGAALERLELPSPPVVDRASLKAYLHEEGVVFEKNNKSDDEFHILIRYSAFIRKSSLPQNNNAYSLYLVKLL